MPTPVPSAAGWPDDGLMDIERLARPEIRSLEGYETAMQVPGTLRLNANEAWAPCDETGSGLNRYPEVRPQRLHERLAEHFGVAQEMLLATRGSSEAIDLLLRAFCRSGRDSILISPPTFAMYRVYADIQGARVLEAPLRPQDDFALDAAALLQTCEPDTKLVFVCSPNNPTGGLVAHSTILAIAEARRDRSLVVVDEAYTEFSQATSATALLDGCENLVVLRTLSKALSLAGVRCGAVLGSPSLIRLLNPVLAPYALATPVVDSVLHALTPGTLYKSEDTVRRTIDERQRMSEALAALPQVLKVWPSRGNFLLVRFRAVAPVSDWLQQEKILIREYRRDPALANCARITIGSREDNDRLLAALARFAAQE